MKNANKVAVLLTGAIILGQISQVGIIEVSAATQKSTTNKTTTNASNKVTYNLSTLDKLSPVKLSAKSYVKLSDVNILPQDDGNILTYTLNFYNGDSKDIQLIDYWSKVKTKSGASLSTQLITKDKTKKKIPPQTQMTLTYFAKIGNINSVNDLMFQLIKWDFNQANYESILGTFKVPGNFTTLTSLGQVKKLRISDIPIQTKLESHQQYTNDSKTYVMVSLSLLNLGFKALEDPKYAYNVVTSDGISYPILIDQSNVNFKVQPRETKNIQLIAELPSTAKTDQLKLQIVSVDDELKINLPVATYSIPSGKSTDVLTDSTAVNTIEISNTKIETRIKETSVSAGQEEANWSVMINFRNTGSKTVKLPQFEPTVTTKEGYAYPVETKAFENVVLNPLEERTISLSASIPGHLTQESVILHLNQSASSGEGDAQSKVLFPVALYALQYTEQRDATDNIKFYVENQYGKFYLSLGSLQVLPWSDGDLVSTKFTIENARPTTVKLPEMGGNLKLDQAILTGDTQVVSTANSLILGPYAKADLYLLAKVPYGLDFQQARITLQEKIGEQLSDFYTLNTKKSNVSVPAIAKGIEYHISTIGKSAVVKERRTLFYSGISSNVMYTELEIKSEETRQSVLSKIEAYYKTKDGQYFQAITGQPEGATSPSGKNLVTVYAKLPRNLDTSDMVLYVGEGVKDGKFTAPKEESTGFVNAVALELDQKKQEPKRNSLSGLDIFPYNLSIPNVSGTLTGGTVNVKFDYYLSRNGEYEIGKFDHKLVFELRDSGGKYFEQELTLEQDLKIGDNQTYSLSFSNPVFEDMKGGSFEVAIYDKFQGEKVKLASQAYYYSSSAPSY